MSVDISIQTLIMYLSVISVSNAFPKLLVLESKYRLGNESNRKIDSGKK